MITIFTVVGEHREHPNRLLLLGEDSQYYVQALSDNSPVPVELDDGWVLDGMVLPLDDLVDPLLPTVRAWQEETPAG